MLSKLTTLFLILTSICSCKAEQQDKHPEAILGIRLGKPYQPQADSLVNAGKLNLTIEGIKYIDFGRYKGSLLEHTYNDDKTLKWLTVLYVDPNNRGILTGIDANKGVLDEYEKNEVVQMYQDKYASHKTETNEYGFTKFIWDRGNLSIELSYKVLGVVEGSSYYLVQAHYRLKPELDKEFDMELKKNNENI